MRRIVLRRLLQIVPLVFAVIVLNFVLIHLAPGSLFDVMTSEQQITDPVMLDQLRHTYGVDQPTWVQLVKYIWSVMRLDLGFSYRQNAPVLDVIVQQLPATALGLFYAATYARVMRASMLEVFRLDFVRTARAKGLSPARVVMAHVMRNALLPIVTLLGLQLGTILGGSVVIEAVFSWPGIGSLLFDSVMSRNFPMVLGVLVLGSLLVAVANASVDLLYLRLDPRIRAR